MTDKLIKTSIFITLTIGSVVQLCFAKNLSSGSSNDFSNNPVISQFIIRPSVCIVEQDAACRSKFIFSWQLTKPTNVCLVSVSQNRTLYCSTDVQVNLAININIDQDERYRLVPKGQSQYAVERTIDVKQLGVDARLLQRKIWSVF